MTAVLLMLLALVQVWWTSMYQRCSLCYLSSLVLNIWCASATIKRVSTVLADKENFNLSCFRTMLEGVLLTQYPGTHPCSGLLDSHEYIYAPHIQPQVLCFPAYWDDVVQSSRTGMLTSTRCGPLLGFKQQSKHHLMCQLCLITATRLCCCNHSK